MAWDPTLYEGYRDARARPFHDLMNSLPERSYQDILDAGCGTGRTTRALAAAYPHARVTGVDLSGAMLGSATSDDRVTFMEADLAVWRPDHRFDLVVSNAVLHWIPEPRAMLHRLASWTTDGGVIAIQVPANFYAPSHRVLRAVASKPRWATFVNGASRGDHILSRDLYAAELEALGFQVKTWDKTYRHKLHGADAVFLWIKGTTLRPYIDAIPSDRLDAFFSDVRAGLDAGYPDVDGTTTFPFTRRFVVAERVA